MKKNVMLFITGLFFFLCASIAQSQPAGIFQFVETRDGRVSVWGIDIRLHRLSFDHKIMPNQIRITGHKYNRDLKEVMTWSVSKDRKTLHIRFRPGMGDFGTGNAVTVHLDSSAIVGEQEQSFEWTIPTDIQ